MFSADARQMITENEFSISRHNFAARPKRFSAFSRPIFVASACCSQLGGKRTNDGKRWGKKELKQPTPVQQQTNSKEAGKNNIYIVWKGKGKRTQGLRSLLEQ